MSRDWGPNGSDHDEFGILPDKRVERMGGFEPVRASQPINRVTFKEMAIDFFKEHGKKPTKLHTVKSDTNSRVIDAMDKLFGYCCVSIIWDSVPNGDQTEWLE